ncbi:MAG: hypothetical protein NWE76_02190 [Candidatus Bathyarchaeota archaeon]|nr:hypothetical protein [Candidatus Bathyarchaeota archaeon]
MAIESSSQLRFVRDFKAQILRTAKDHCFFTGLNDSGAELCKANVPYGVAAVHCLQKYLGKEANATFVATPDMTTTRNSGRWKSGFSYGGKISWGSGNTELVILDTKPNACGMLVGGLDDLPDMEELIRRLHDIEARTTEIDGINVTWNFHKGNHFIDVFEIRPVGNAYFGFPPYAFIIHSSADELKGDNKLGFGLYHDESEQLRGMEEVIDTPCGEIHYLRDGGARRYFERYLYAESFAKRKRRLFAESLFDKYAEISNETHQGLVNMNEIVLGCHHSVNSSSLFPLTLKGDLPSYLVRANPNLSLEAIELLGFEKRARTLGVYDRLLNADVIPHGGGYIFPDILCVNRVIEVNGTRYFEVEMENDRGRKIISDVREIPYAYRGRRVLQRAMEIGLVEVIAKLVPHYVLKI